MKHHVAFAGFRHPHVLTLWEHVKSHPDCEIIAVYEPDQATRDNIHASHGITATYDDYERMLSDSGCTIVAIGAVYSERGQLIKAALNAGCHVIADKPLCTRLEELNAIACLSKDKGLSVGCMFDLVEIGVMRRLREIVREGVLGKVCTVTVAAQHPLRYGTRAPWYFEPGQHGGTINDIGIHVFDLIPWLTGRKWQALLTAREWNAKAVLVPHFKDCAQIHAVLEDEIVCFADLSYLAPDQMAYELPQYWRISVHGTKGMAETSCTASSVVVITDYDTTRRELPGIADAPAAYLQDFLSEIEGYPTKEGLTIDRVLTVARWALEAQARSSLVHK